MSGDSRPRQHLIVHGIYSASVAYIHNETALTCCGAILTNINLSSRDSCGLGEGSTIPVVTG